MGSKHAYWEILIPPHQGAEREKVAGIPVVTDDSVPRDEVHLRSVVDGKAQVAKIVGIGDAEQVDPGPIQVAIGEDVYRAGWDHGDPSVGLPGIYALSEEEEKRLYFDLRRLYGGNDA